MLKVIILDYDENRLNHLDRFIRDRVPGSTATPILTQPYSPGDVPDARILAQVQALAKGHRLLIGHLGGNPSGYDGLRVYKAANPSGRAVLYTKGETIEVDKLRGLKLADRVFRRSPDDTQVFADADQMLDLINDVMAEPGVGYVRGRLKDPVFLTALGGVAGFGTATVGLVAKLVGG